MLLYKGRGSRDDYDDYRMNFVSVYQERYKEEFEMKG